MFVKNYTKLIFASFKVRQCRYYSGDARKV